MAYDKTAYTAQITEEVQRMQASGDERWLKNEVAQLVREGSGIFRASPEREEKLRVIHDALAVVGISSGLF